MLNLAKSYFEVLNGDQRQDAEQLKIENTKLCHAERY